MRKHIYTKVAIRYPLLQVLQDLVDEICKQHHIEVVEKENIVGSGGLFWPEHPFYDLLGPELNAILWIAQGILSHRENPDTKALMDYLANTRDLLQTDDPDRNVRFNTMWGRALVLLDQEISKAQSLTPSR
jgi:hypothetical protein